MKTIGWVLCFLLVVSAAAAWAERLSVSVSVANIRSGPGEKYDILWAVEKYYPIDVFQKTGQWYHFSDFEKDRGWIHASLVSKIPAVITQKENCSIRSGPGTQFAVLFTVEKGIPFKVLDRKKGWIHVRHADGDSGWIHESLVW